MDEQIGVDTRFQTCVIEEFVLIQCGKVGFCLHPSMTKGWDGKATCWDAEGRVATIDVEIDGCNIRFGSVYMPVHNSEGIEGRKTCLAAVKEASQEIPGEACAIFGGDWNSHIGRDNVNGRQAMAKDSSEGGKMMLKW